MNPQKSDRLATGVILFFAAIVSLIVLTLVVYLLAIGLPHVSWHFLTSPASSFTAGGGIRDQLFNSFYLVVLTLIVSVPLSLGAAIYLSEYAPQNRLTNTLRLAIEVLSSLPSVVVGLFGYLVFVLQWKMDFSLLAGALALTIINLPLLTRSCETALSQVPFLQRQAGLGAGDGQVAGDNPDRGASCLAGDHDRGDFIGRPDLRGGRRFNLHGRAELDQRFLQQLEPIQPNEFSKPDAPGRNPSRPHLEAQHRGTGSRRNGGLGRSRRRLNPSHFGIQPLGPLRR